MRRYKKTIIFFNISILLFLQIPLYNQYEKDEMKIHIENIYNKRCEALKSGDSKDLPELFDVSQRHGKWALEHEVKRVNYLKDWALNRKIKFTDIHSNVAIRKMYSTRGTLRVILSEIYKFNYIYPEDIELKVNSFGVGIRHTVDLVNKDEKWVISNDWYTDCFEDALSQYSGDVPGISDYKCPDRDGFCEVNVRWNSKYNREMAVKYADEYCGANWNNSDGFKYNKKYSDYTGIGGDCTNFASQILGDKHAGGLYQDGSWHCKLKKYGGSEGSRAWVNADGFKQYLLYSGKGRVIKAGKFKELVNPTENNPKGIVGKLEPGDLVCYAKKSDIDHFAIVTGADSHGYPYVNSHTTDRYHVPWDLGWSDKQIKFYLIHIR